MLDSPKELLTDYLGTYYSAELESEFKITLASNNLYFKSKSCSPSHLRVAGQNLFLIYPIYAEHMQISLNLCEIKKVELSVYIVVMTGCENSTLANNK
jgi:hypothetical protein